VIEKSYFVEVCYYLNNKLIGSTRSLCDINVVSPELLPKAFSIAIEKIIQNGKASLPDQFMHKNVVSQITFCIEQ
jgi:hypothetical protein